MSKPQRQYPFKFGRVFFPSEVNPIPSEVRFQALGNHVGNVRKLVKCWRKNDFPSESSFDQVLEAASIHDNGKPQRFEIIAKIAKSKFQEYTYSFRGHRFLAKSKKDAWAEALAIGHHDFSVEDICRDAYTLKKEQHYAEILTKEPLAYARELYILEMCDQIEAELACRVFEDGKQAESRAFMDFTITQDESEPTTYLIDPWAFEPELNFIELTFRCWSMQPAELDTDGELQKCLKDNREGDLGKTLDRITKRWWQSQQGQPKESISKTIILKPYRSAITSKEWTAKDFYQQLAGFTPNPMQAEMFEAIYDPNDEKHPAILLKSSTGSGKFESVLFPALASNYRLILPLPARSLLEDQKERIEKYLKKFSILQKDREVSLVVDTGSQMYRWVYKNGDETKRTSNLRRHLYKGDVILTTLDKFLYRYFGFGDKQKSFTFPLRIHREKTLICFDEAHSYDEISFTNFHSLVKALYEAGRSLILMTATMPKEYIERFDYLNSIDYVDELEKVEKLKQFQQQTLRQPYLNQKGFEWISHIQRDSEVPEIFQHEFAQIILREWTVKTDRRLIAVVERVKDAAAIYQYLNNYLSGNTDAQGRFLFLYHGRIADQLRPSIYKQLQERDSKNQPYLLITTSAIEVGCDLNAEVLVSEICPPENLIQRAGRCNRKGNISDAKVIVVGNSIPDFANSLDESGWQKYQETLTSLEKFDTQAIIECISRSEHVDDYRVVEVFSMLHDYVYGADLTCKTAHEKGLVITRSWTPSATLIYKDGSKDQHKIKVPIDRLIKNDNNQYANTHVYEHYYNQETTRWDVRNLGWGSAYLKDIVIEIHPNNEAALMYEDKPEYPYNPELGFVELPGVFIKLKTNDFEEKLLCKHTDNKSAIITYTKALNPQTY
ncbi:CRISPR-associated helicase Cas3' [Iningainema tapete]|uniref:CRISPR-associated helicase Cas3 n=1 Tax=Iningainema tapete BLCC-T55 TaxID=2748662 RepID=A0A8J6XNI6_9CYAN|nr:CRISPR-associated helicase Cas3' [Iningainema tapete]MBD2773677.1 CRISPR-associated helicase Cas3' [Iningainema tapete BLCC-T55]